MKTSLLTSCIILAVGSATVMAAPADPTVAKYDGLLKKVQADPAGTTEAEVMQLLGLAKRLARPYGASLAVRGYLSNHFDPSQQLLRATAEAAYLAGDYTFAAARLKTYLIAAKPTAESAKTAALLYTLLIDQLAAGQDAFEFIHRHGLKFRAFPPARRFDAWFLEQARMRNDYAAVADMLAAAVGDKMPAAQFRLYYGESMEWLLQRIPTAQPLYYPALPACRRIAAAIRGEKVRGPRMAFYVANLAYWAGSAGKDDAALTADLAEPLRAAKAYFDADPTAKTLQHILASLTRSTGLHTTYWDKARAPKQAFFAAAFGKLSNADKEAMLQLRWDTNRLATHEQWLAILKGNSAFFAASAATTWVPFQVHLIKTRDEFRQLAPLCKNAADYRAAVIRAVAAGNELTQVIDILIRDDAWHMTYGQYNHIINTEIFRAWRQIHEGDKVKTAAAYFDKAWVHYGSKYLVNSPVAIHDPTAVRSYLTAVWNLGEANGRDMSHVPGLLARLAWVPYGNSGNKRRNVRVEMFRGISDRAKRWADELRAADKAGKAKGPALAQLQRNLKQIAPVMDAIKKLIARADINKAPNPLCKAMAQLAEAQWKRANESAARKAVYQIVRRYDTAKTPYGREAFDRVIAPAAGGGKQALFDVLLEMLTDQLTDLQPGNRREADARRLIATMYPGRGGMQLHGVNAKQKDKSLKVADVLGAAVIRLAEKGQFSTDLYTWFRGTRRGNRWTGGKRGQDVFVKLMEKRIFQKANYRGHATGSATVNYIRAIQHEFPELAKTYPTTTAFDDMFVAEARAARFLDWSFLDHTRDTKGKIAAVAAEILSAGDLPIGVEREGTYSPRTLQRWMDVALKAAPAARNAMLAKVEAAYGKTRFDAHAMGYGRFTDGDDPQPADRKAFFAALSRYLDRAATAPDRMPMPTLKAMAALKAEDVTDAELAVLMRIFTELAPSHWRDRSYDKATILIITALAEAGRMTDLLAMAGPAWKACRDIRDHNTMRSLTSTVAAMRKAASRDTAMAYSSAGLTVMKRDLPEDIRRALGGIRSWALAGMGGMIPVARGHPLHLLYEAQLAYLSGRYQSAWEKYLPQRGTLAKSFQEFDPMFSAWVIEKHTEFRDFDAAELLAREVIVWLDGIGDRFEPEVRGRLSIAYANVALARDDRPRARALYERIVANKAFAGTRSQMDAELHIADVDTRDGNYDRAIERLEILVTRKHPYLQVEGAFHMSLVRYAQEEYAEAKDQLDKLFVMSPDHAEARILEGKVNLKLKKLEQPTDIDLGERIGKKYILPGQPIRVTLVDQNLAVVRKATEIEIRAWTDSGDEELFTLTSFGDSKTKFKGQIPTTLGAPVKGDNVLQVVGKDRVHYAFSERFAALQKIESNPPFTLLVATDAELYVSSGAILTKELREARALERMIRRRLGPEEVGEDASAPLSTVRREDQIKPGNPIHIRVVDPDRGETPANDRITVRLATSNGDVIKAFELVETEPYSGIFEGSVPTEPAQATAFASDSREGAEPNFTIAKGDYPAWVGLPKITQNRPKSLSIDLNDNVQLGTMKITANEKARGLKSFRVQTSLNGKDFTTQATWPETFEPWTGQATVTVARYQHPALVGSASEFRDYVEQGHLRYEQLKMSGPLKTLASVNWDYKLDGLGAKLGLHANKNTVQPYVAHIKAAFYQPRRKNRTFTLTPRGRPVAGRSIRYMLVLDGKVAIVRGASHDSFGVHEVSAALGRGVHVLEIFVLGEANTKAGFGLSCDTDEPPYVVPCPADMFDVAKHPEIAAGLARKAAIVTAGDENTTFEVAFAAKSRARVIRLLMTDFETDAPAVNHITLTDAAGKTILPTKHDFMALRTNEVLEIVPGDRVTVTYEDTKPLTIGREQHEAFLTATYTNATLRTCFVEYHMGKEGRRTARYIGMRRFGAGDKVNVFINDPDGDVTDKLDTLPFTVRTSDGGSIELEAMETEEHSGVFLGVIFPVAGEPKRKSELRVKAGENVIVTYLDRENVNPGIAWDRQSIVEQVWYAPPKLRVYEVSSLALEEADRLAGRRPTPAAKNRREALQKAGQPAILSENVPARRTLLAVRPKEVTAAKPTPYVIGGPLLVEVLFPTITKSQESTCILYAQTAAGRKKFGKPIAAGTFATDVPGTIKLERMPGDAGAPPTPPGYREVIVRRNPYALSALDEGRYTFAVPVVLGPLPDKTLIHAAEEAAEAPRGTFIEPVVLSINGTDTIYLGLQYTDPAGKDHWETREVTLTGDLFFDVTDRRYQEPVEGAFVGESLYFRVIDPTRDTTDEKDRVALDLTTKSGQVRKVELLETFTHSGVFKGLARLVHASDTVAVKETGTMPTIYGDLLTAKCARGAKGPVAEHTVTIHKGADGEVLPFTKRFKDPAVAVQTQFMIAEAYFELAKRHRELNQESLARREIAQGQKLLTEAIRDYPNTTARAQAEYLLADLSLEFGNDAANEILRKKFYTDAIARYSDIVASYPESEYAPKAQFRKALAYEKLDRLDDACEEYVKLSYRYPDNPLVAETIARLGQYFLNKGRGLHTQAEALDDPIEREKGRLQAAAMFKTAGQVFARLSERFPAHALAGKTLLLSAQCYMQAEEYDVAVKGYNRVIKTPGMQSELIAEAMYWAGHSHMEANDTAQAYQMFKNLTWDYPASKWAKFARGRLADEVFLNME